MRPAANRHAHLLQALENIRTLAERADRNAIDRLLTQPSATHILDDHTLDFLRRAQDLLLSITQMTNGALESQGRHVEIDIAEAWRRAYLHLPRRDGDPILVHMQEFDDGYQAIPVKVPVPEAPPVPTCETATTLVIDKATGIVTCWPLLAPDVLARQYRRYKGQTPMTFDDHPI